MLPAAVTTIALVLAAQNVGSGGAGALQPVDKAQPQPLRRIESGVADVDPLGLSFRQLAVDLRQPVGFSGVYQVPASRSPTGRAAFARISGATTAVFDQSTYGMTPRGATPTIAPGTVFYIGGLPGPLPTARGIGEGGTLLSTAIDLRAPVISDSTAGSSKVQTMPVSSAALAESPPSESPMTVAAERVAGQWPQDATKKPQPGVTASTISGPTPSSQPSTAGILGDEAYRGTRVAELLRKAAEQFAANTPAK